MEIIISTSQNRAWLDLGRRLARLPARPSAWPACTRAPRRPRPVIIFTILLLYIDFTAVVYDKTFYSIVNLMPIVLILDEKLVILILMS